MGEQPDQADPAGTSLTQPARAPSEQLPRVQLFERLTGRWVEFEGLQRSRTYRIASPGQYLDTSGSLLVRFVDRSPTASEEFTFHVRIDGVAR
jgi:hypothetical protein